MLCADLNAVVPRQAFSRKSARESITRSPACAVRKSLKPPENVNIINVREKPCRNDRVFLLDL